MKIHEFQAKQILAKYSVPMPKGRVAASAGEARAIAQELGGKVVVKAQIHAGGRGKGGGVKLANSPEEAAHVFSEIMGMQLITHQTGPQGQRVKTVLIEEQMPIERELYLAVLIDGASGRATMMASAAGGMEIEEVAAKTPEAIHRVSIDPVVGFQPHLARELCFDLDLTGDLMKPATKLMSGLYDAFVASDASLAEINPMVVTKDGRVLALDAKMNIDDNALFRHPDIEALRDKDEEDPSEVEAAEKGINNFIKLDGNIGCLVNGAGLAMATMDSINVAGGEPANFLDIATANDVNKVVDALKIIAADKNVKAILVNIFGGMARVDVIAQGIIEAQRQMPSAIPVVARLAGTNVEEGERLIRESGLPVIRAEDLGDAAKKAVEAAR
ncbi:MAG: ADP-forming succinate--CoA ligase subunit beta [Chloroflexota bacterium]|nr:ADP-forming succinate--CoA ligase subunit beta [Chloroflexota bacterium]